MKTKRIVIQSSEESWDKALSFARKLDKKQKVKPQKGEYFESLEAVRNLLTEKRLELWRAIRDEKPVSIHSLAKLVDRDFKSVHRDISVLVAVGLVELKRADKGPAQRPISLADQLRLDVA